MSTLSEQELKNMVVSNSLKESQFIRTAESEREIQTLKIKIKQTSGIMSNLD